MLADPSIITALTGVAPVGTTEAAARLSFRRFRRSGERLEVVAAGAPVEDADLTAFEVLNALHDEPEALAGLASTGGCNASRRKVCSAIEGALADLAADGSNVKWHQTQIKLLKRGEFEGLGLKCGLPWPIADGGVAYRLRTLRDAPSQVLTPKDVLRLAEAAGLAARQHCLNRALGLPATLPADLKKPEPLWQREAPYLQGYELARRTREALSLAADEPICSLHSLVEDRLGIPIVRTSLSKDVSGATVDVGGQRGIVLNTNGHNENVWTRRGTLAHELCHLLWDESAALHELHVDHYDETDAEPHAKNQKLDRREQRANAFAAAFLAPMEAAKTRYDAASTTLDGLRSVMVHFGISRATALNHLTNAGCLRVSTIGVNMADTEAWRTAENPLLDELDVESLEGEKSIGPSRTGRFAALVACAVSETLLSRQTAAAWLDMSPHRLDAGWQQTLAALNPEIFAGAAASRSAQVRHERNARLHADRHGLPAAASAHPADWIALLAGVVIDHDSSYRALMERTRRRGYSPSSLLCVNPSQRFAAV